MGARRTVKRGALAYSGGLDTSIIVPWLKENYSCEVVCYCSDVGQGTELDGLEAKARKIGASHVVVEDLKLPFVRDFCFPTLRAGAVYEGTYLLGTSLARPLIAARQVRCAEQTGADALAHGCTGKGNDQVRFELTYMALAPHLPVIAPWREWDIVSREDAIRYAERHRVPIAQTRADLYSRDANLWHISHEGGPLEDPANAPPESMWKLTASPDRQPAKQETVTIGFESGRPVRLNGRALDPVVLAHGQRCRPGDEQARSGERVGERRVLLARVGEAVVHRRDPEEHRAARGERQPGGARREAADVAQPPAQPEGAEHAVLEGDPARPGLFTMQLRFPDGYRVPPHWHTQVERITVIDGTLHVGHGDEFDRVVRSPNGEDVLFAPRRLPLWVAYFSNENGLYAVNNRVGAVALDAWASLTWLATHTQRIRFGPMVCPLTFYHPALLAKRAAAVSELSGGRFDLGIGAGWHEGEHAMFGLPFPPLKERLDRLECGARVIRALGRGQPITLEQPYYPLREAQSFPLPPGGAVPLIVGGRGERRTLRKATEHQRQRDREFSNLHRED